MCFRHTNSLTARNIATCVNVPARRCTPRDAASAALPAADSRNSGAPRRARGTCQGSPHTPVRPAGTPPAGRAGGSCAASRPPGRRSTAARPETTSETGCGREHIRPELAASLRTCATAAATDRAQREPDPRPRRRVVRHRRPQKLVVAGPAQELDLVLDDPVLARGGPSGIAGVQDKDSHVVRRRISARPGPDRGVGRSRRRPRAGPAEREPDQDSQRGHPRQFDQRVVDAHRHADPDQQQERRSMDLLGERASPAPPASVPGQSQQRQVGGIHSTKPTGHNRPGCAGSRCGGGRAPARQREGHPVGCSRAPPITAFR